MIKALNQFSLVVIIPLPGLLLAPILPNPQREVRKVKVVRAARAVREARRARSLRKAPRAALVVTRTAATLTASSTTTGRKNSRRMIYQMKLRA